MTDNVELADQRDVSGESKIGDDANQPKKAKKSVLGAMKESNKAAALYSYGVIPNFFRDAISKEDAHPERPTNKRKSTQYTWLTFFPIAFGLQFKKLINIFYIITGILNFFPSIQVNKPVVVLVPVCLIMLLGVAGLFVGELKRYREDKVVNATPVKRLALPGSPEHANNPKGEIRWENSCLADIKVGDIIRIDDLE